MQARFITAIGLSLLSLLMPAAKAESAAESAHGYRNSALEHPLRTGDQRFLINPHTSGDRPMQPSAIEVHQQDDGSRLQPDSDFRFLSALNNIINAPQHLAPQRQDRNHQHRNGMPDR